MSVPTREELVALAEQGLELIDDLESTEQEAKHDQAAQG